MILIGTSDFFPQSRRSTVYNILFTYAEFQTVMSTSKNKTWMDQIYIFILEVFPALQYGFWTPDGSSSSIGPWSSGGFFPKQKDTIPIFFYFTSYDVIWRNDILEKLLLRISRSASVLPSNTHVEVILLS